MKDTYKKDLRLAMKGILNEMKKEKEEDIPKDQIKSCLIKALNTQSVKDMIILQAMQAVDLKE